MEFINHFFSSLTSGIGLKTHSSSLLLLLLLICCGINLSFIVPSCYAQASSSQGAVITDPNPILTYKIASILEKPYLMVKKDHKTLHGNEKYEGFAKDLAESLSKRMNFSYAFDLSQNEYGYYNRSSLRWNGIINLLQQSQTEEGTPQFAIGPITITKARSQVVLFSTPFMEFQFALLMKKPTIDIDSDPHIGGYKEPDAVYKVNGDDDDDDEDDDDEEYEGQYIFLRPMSTWLWIVFILSIIFTVILIFIVEKIISQKWSAAQEEIINRERAPDSKVTILPKPVGLCTNGIIGSPRTTAGRFLQIIFWIYIAIFVAAYIATFSADRIVDELNDEEEETFDPKSFEPIINTIEELVGQDDVQFAVLRSGSTYEYFLHTSNSKLRKANSMMEASDIVINSIDEGVERVRDQNGSFVFIMEEPTARAIAGRRPCDLMVSSELFGPKQGFGIAMSESLNQAIARRINLEILDMKENEELDVLEKKWFQGQSQCSNDPRKKIQPSSAPTKENGVEDDDDDDDDDKTNDQAADDDNDDDNEDDDADNALCIREMAGIFYILAVALVVTLIVAIVEICFASKNTMPLNSARDEGKEIELRVQPPPQSQPHQQQQPQQRQQQQAQPQQRQQFQR